MSARAVYSAKLVDEAYHPSHIGRMGAPDAYGRSMGWCGDMMGFYLRLDGECIEAAKFMTDGCGPTIAWCRAGGEHAAERDLWLAV